MRIGNVVSATAALLFAACSSDPESRLVAPSPTRVVAIAIVSGDNQEAKAGEQLVQPLVIRVMDEVRRGVEGVPVLFQLSGAGGLNGKQSSGVLSVSTQTAADGSAQVIVEPYDIGRLSVTASVAGSSLAPVTFTANATVVVVQFRSPDGAGAYAAFYGPCRCARTINSVTVPVGSPVEWVTPDPSSYTITSVASPAGAAGFDSGTLARASRFRFVPAVAGTWEYEDRVSGLRATLTTK